VMTPKSLLRHKLAVSDLGELAAGSFQPVIDDVDAPAPEAVRRVLLTAGRIYYDLLTEKRDGEHGDTAILRLEQCYPFPEALLTRMLGRYDQATEFVWVQDEPENQGYLGFVEPRLNALLQVRGQSLHAVARDPAAAPAVGYPEVHKTEQQALLRRSFGPITSRDTPRPTE